MSREAAKEVLDAASAAVRRRPEWFVVDHETDAIVLGPFRSGETAGAERRHLERDGDLRNLWVVRR